MNRSGHVVVSFLLAAAPHVGLAQVPKIADSVVRIVNYSQRGVWSSPWEVTSVSESAGSGFVIDGGSILTNAHVVSDSRYLLVFLLDDPDPHEATVEQIGHDSDLALVRPLDAELLQDVPPVTFGGVPTPGSLVTTYGFPVGGSHISATQGIVSRVEPQRYVHSGVDVHLAGQTDAAINPGNSGGPVVQDGRVVGVAFQAAEDLTNVGYFIPTEVVERFLRDVSDGHYDGYPELGIERSNMHNEAARRHAGMRGGETGVRVDRVFPLSSADGLIHEGDIILEAGGRTVANDGSVADGDGRVDFGMLTDRYQVGETMDLKVLRNGTRLRLSVPVFASRWGDLRSNVYGRLPRYYIYAGLVFVPLELETMKTMGANWSADSDKGLLYEFLLRPIQQPELLNHERVVMLRLLPHPVNADWAWTHDQVIKRVNGRDITSIEDLIRAIEENDGDFHFFEFENYRRFGVLDRREADAAQPEILERYGITQDRNL